MACPQGFLFDFIFFFFFGGARRELLPVGSVREEGIHTRVIGTFGRDSERGCWDRRKEGSDASRPFIPRLSLSLRSLGAFLGLSLGFPP